MKVGDAEYRILSYFLRICRNMIGITFDTYGIKYSNGYIYISR